jgi:hypothetical protein
MFRETAMAGFVGRLPILMWVGLPDMQQKYVLLHLLS